jgi:hypothetical protein
MVMKIHELHESIGYKLRMPGKGQSKPCHAMYVFATRSLLGDNIFKVISRGHDLHDP